MSKVLDSLSQLISQSSIPLSDQNDLLVFLPVLPEKLLEDLVSLFKEKPELIVEFNENFKAKLNVLIDGRDQFEKLMAEEEKMLEKEEEEREKNGHYSDF